MKKSNKCLSIILIFLATQLITFIGHSQTSDNLSYVSAFNGSGMYHTSAGSVFTWSGSTRNYYCNGYGTIQWYHDGSPSDKYTGYVQDGKNEGYGVFYYANGHKSYDGYWKNDMRNGYGTSFHEDGTIEYQGYFTNDAWSKKADLDEEAEKLTNSVILKVFDGGTDVRYGVVKGVYARDGDLEEIRVKMTFHGNINTKNYYRGTLVINYKTNYVDFIDYNDNFSDYLLIKGIGVFINYINSQSRH